MKPVPNSQGFKTKWANYKTGVKDIYFRMKAEQEFASIGIEITHSDDELQELFLISSENSKKSYSPPLVKSGNGSFTQAMK
jgi:hypothetical protein